MVVTGLKTCDNCKKAVKALAAQGVSVRLRDLRDEPVTAGEINSWYAQFGGSLLNTRSTTWRNLSEAERADDPLALMATHPALIKRPVVETPNDRYLGWTTATRGALGLSD
nr:ArsC/Spx/MgsR family protein [Jannaschia faecimaris]